MIGNRVYLVIYEQDRNNPIFSAYSVGRMLQVYKCEFDDVNTILAGLNNNQVRPLNWHVYTRDQFTDFFFGGIAEDWK
jgi:hypothetical protein